MPHRRIRIGNRHRHDLGNLTTLANSIDDVGLLHPVVVHPDGRLIPFDTYNLFYRDNLEQTRLAPLRAWAER